MKGNDFHCVLLSFKVKHYQSVAVAVNPRDNPARSKRWLALAYTTYQHALKPRSSTFVYAPHTCLQILHSVVFVGPGAFFANEGWIVRCFHCS